MVLISFVLYTPVCDGDTGQFRGLSHHGLPHQLESQGVVYFFHFPTVVNCLAFSSHSRATGMPYFLHNLFFFVLCDDYYCLFLGWGWGARPTNELGAPYVVVLLKRSERPDPCLDR